MEPQDFTTASLSKWDVPAEHQQGFESSYLAKVAELHAAEQARASDEAYAQTRAVLSQLEGGVAASTARAVVGRLPPGGPCNAVVAAIVEAGSTRPSHVSCIPSLCWHRAHASRWRLLSAPVDWCLSTHS